MAVELVRKLPVCGKQSLPTPSSLSPVSLTGRAATWFLPGPGGPSCGTIPWTVLLPCWQLNTVPCGARQVLRALCDVNSTIPNTCRREVLLRPVLQRRQLRPREGLWPHGEMLLPPRPGCDAAPSPGLLPRGSRMEGEGQAVDQVPQEAHHPISLILYGN